jgi:hypothetical protein
LGEQVGEAVEVEIVNERMHAGVILSPSLLSPTRNFRVPIHVIIG